MWQGAHVHFHLLPVWVGQWTEQLETPVKLLWAGTFLRGLSCPKAPPGGTMNKRQVRKVGFKRLASGHVGLWSPGCQEDRWLASPQRVAAVWCSRGWQSKGTLENLPLAAALQNFAGSADWDTNTQKIIEWYVAKFWDETLQTGEMYLAASILKLNLLIVRINFDSFCLDD